MSKMGALATGELGGTWVEGNHLSAGSRVVVF